MYEGDLADYRRMIEEQAGSVRRSLLRIDGLLADLETEWPAAYHARGTLTGVRYIIDALIDHPERIGDPDAELWP